MKSLNPAAYCTDKAMLPHYLENYERYFAPFVDKEVTLLELGVAKGGSLLLWRDYFTKGAIVGLDIEPVTIADPSGRIRVYKGRQQDTGLLDQIARETAPHGFDIVIDDCSHIGELARITFHHIFDNHLKPGGLYVIEDWGAGYWDSWRDGVAYRARRHRDSGYFASKLRSAVARLQRGNAGRLPLAGAIVRGIKRALYRTQFTNHHFGMSGFIKELVDECGRADITHPELGSPPFQPSKIREIRISHGHVFVVKA